MKILNEHGLKFSGFVSRVPPRPLTATFVVKATFGLRPGGYAELLPEDAQPEFSGDAFHGDDPAQGLRYASDFAPFKPGADVLLAGHCHAPAGRALVQAEVQFAVGRRTKRLVVIGDRSWQAGPLGLAASAPQPFSAMPLTWARAFGGPGEPRNPIGRGRGQAVLEDGTTARLLPNIESLSALVAAPDDRPAPVGFGPIDTAWPLRSAATATYDQAWLAERWPWLPDDFDWRYFNAAPPDQQWPGEYLRGDEVLRFKGLHPEHATYECALPGTRVRLFVRRRVGLTLSFEEVELRLDTLFADMDAETVTLVWRGVVAADTMKLREFEEAFVVVEPGAVPAAADLEGFRQLYDARRAELAAADKMQFVPIDPIIVIPPRLPDTAWADRLRAAVAAIPSSLPNDAAHPLDAEWKKAYGGPRPVMPAPAAPAVSTLAEGEAHIRAELAKLRAAEPGTAKVFDSVPMDFASFDRDIQADDAATAMPEDAGDGADEVPDDSEWSAARARKHAAAGGSFAEADLSGLDLANCDFSGLNFREAILDEAHLDGCRFDDCDLGDASLMKATLADASLRGARLHNADLSQVEAPVSCWQNANLTGAEFAGGKLPGADFRGCTGAQAGFSGCDLAKADFQDCVLEQPDFSAASLPDGNFANATLPDAAFYGIVAPGASFEGATILKGRFSDAQVDRGNFSRCRLDDGVLENARLAGASFVDADLAGAIFTGASAPNAMFKLARCVNAKFDDAGLARARFVQTNLFRASFENADLTEATFLGSNCYEVEFFEAVTTGTVFDQTNLKGTKLG